MISLFALQMAASKAIMHSKHDSLTSHSINTEIPFNLSPFSKISESLKQFGIQNETSAILVGSYDIIENVKMNST